MRRDGKTLGQMAREEIGKVGGLISLVTVLLIMVVLLAVVALVVVNALRSSPWGTFTIAVTIPVALMMGLYLRFIRPGKVLECSIVGFLLVLATIYGGKLVAASTVWAPWFTWSGLALAGAIVVYGFLASTLPVWLLLAPRDYLSTFVKLGVIFLLAFGIRFHRPTAGHVHAARTHEWIEISMLRWIGSNGAILIGEERRMLLHAKPIVGEEFTVDLHAHAVIGLGHGYAFRGAQ
jgi:carbon starvation protein